MVTVETVRDYLQRMSEMNGPEKAGVLRSFFKSGLGQYACGDCFYGVSVPQLRAFLADSGVRSMGDEAFYRFCHQLLLDSYHEMRMLALLAMVDRIRRGSGELSHMFDFYMGHIRCVNNWDLVDISAPAIVGAYALAEGKVDVLYKLSKFPCLWEQRIAVVASLAYIKAGMSEPTFRLADSLMFHEHDLIHKAVGWMLRECGKRVGKNDLCAYLESELGTFGDGIKKGRGEAMVFQGEGIPRYRLMPRTMLRYAIEKFSKQEKEKYM